MIKIIFFDFDGVIVDSVDLKTRAFADLFRTEGESVVEQVVCYHLKNTGVSRYDKFRYIYWEILHRSLGDEEFKSLCERFAKLVIDGVVNAPYVEGAIEFLQDYAFKYKCFVVSATPQDELEEIIQRRGIAKFFQKYYGAPVKKADAVRCILISEGIKPLESLYVGDAIADYKAARDNGVHFIARINNNENIFSDISCIKVKDIRDLVAITADL